MNTNPNATRPLDLSRLRQRLDAATGMRSGFVTDEVRLELPHVVRLDGLCRAVLGHHTFCRALTAARLAATRLAPMGWVAEAVYDDGRVRVGYEFRFADADAAGAFRAEYAALLPPGRASQPLEPAVA